MCWIPDEIETEGKEADCVWIELNEELQRVLNKDIIHDRHASELIRLMCNYLERKGWDAQRLIDAYFNDNVVDILANPATGYTYGWELKDMEVMGESPLGIGGWRGLNS